MKSTKKSFLLSVLSLIVCVAMLVSTTFAWFTDSVKSGKNKIQAGNLDIELEYLDTTGETATWKPVTENVSLFNDSALWEPGHTEVAYLRLSNKGTLALKYNLAINVYNEKEGTNVAGDSFKLSDYINMGVDEDWDGTAYADRAAARAAVTDAGSIKVYTKAGNMLPGEASTKTFAIVVYMPEEVGNVANYKTGTVAPYIEMGVEVIATQLTNEKDSFDDQYDVAAPWMGDVAEVPAEVEGVITINSAEELAGFAKSVNSGNTYSGKTIKLGKDIDLNNINFPTAKGGNGCNFTFDGNGKTIKNLKIDGEKGVGLFQYCAGATVKNLTVDGANVSGINQVGVIFGQAMCATIENCTVKNATVISSVYNNDDGDKAGAIVGYLTAQPKASIKDCVVENCTIKGYRDIAGAVGYIQGADATNVIVKNTTVICDKSNNYKNYAEDSEYDIGEIFGEESAPIITNCEATDVDVIYANGASEIVAQQVAAAKAGDTIKILPGDAPVELPNLTKAITIKGDGENTKVSTNQTKITADGAVISDMTINGNGAQGTAGELNISGDNTTVKNVTFIGEGCGEKGNRKLAVTVSTDGDGVVFDNVSISNAFRGIQFWKLSGNSVIRNSVLDINGYTFNVDAVVPNSTLTIENSTLNGWTSYTNGIKLVSFKDCKFGENGYKILKAYSNTKIENCEFCEGFAFSTAGSDTIEIVINNCTLGGVQITADNFASFIDGDDGWVANATAIVDGITVEF